MRVCIIIQHISVAFDRHNHRAGRHNLQPTIGDYLKDHIEIFVSVCEVVNRKPHRVSAFLNTRRRGRGAAHGSDIVEAVVGNGRKALHIQCCTCIGLHGGVTRDVNPHRKWRDGQCARHIVHMIVTLFSVTGRCDGVVANILAGLARQRVMNDA